MTEATRALQIAVIYHNADDTVSSGVRPRPGRQAGEFEIFTSIPRKRGLNHWLERSGSNAEEKLLDYSLSGATAASLLEERRRIKSALINPVIRAHTPRDSHPRVLAAALDSRKKNIIPLPRETRLLTLLSSFQVVILPKMKIFSWTTASRYVRGRFFEEAHRHARKIE